VRIRPFPGLAIVSAVVVLAAAGYHFATTGADAPGEGGTAIPDHDVRAPRLIPRSVEVASEGHEEGQATQPEDRPPRLQELPINQLLELAVHSASAWTRADAVEELAARRSNQALPVLLDRLADLDGDVRRAAADGLAELGNQAALAVLERAMSAEAVEKTRLAMAQAIAELLPSGGIPAAE
jgi:HEAT repeat protein